MALGGNLLTRYNYQHSRWRVRRTPHVYEIEVAAPDGRLMGRFDFGPGGRPDLGLSMKLCSDEMPTARITAN